MSRGEKRRNYGGGEMANIMIIDDQPAVLRALRRTLERAGHEVTQASDGKTALRHFTGNPTDLVISDIYMPEMDGIEFLLRVREIFPEARIVAMSGGGHLPKDRVLRAASILGAVAVLEKPFSQAEVLEAVHAALERFVTPSEECWIQ